MNDRLKIVGYSHSGYNQMRNIYGNNLEGFIFKQQKKDFFKVLDHLHFKLKKRTNSTYHNIHVGLSDRDLFHYFNGVNIGTKPWISTFETSLPRVSSLASIAIRQLANSSCKQLISLSKCSYNIQFERLQESPASLRDLIMNKTLVLHPPQKTIINTIEEKQYDTILTFTIIGADFFRKGGLEILEAFDYFLDKKQELKLNIVSTMQYGDYASQATIQDLNRASGIIKKYPDYIQHYKSLPNQKVLDLLKNSHVALLPTYADTYGYSVLEAQACGCAVVSTDIRALPEINSNEVGYVIEVPKNEMGNGLLNTKEARGLFSSKIKENLIEIILKMISNPNELRQKGNLSLSRIKKYHDPTLFREELQKIYINALET